MPFPQMTNDLLTWRRIPGRLIALEFQSLEMKRLKKMMLNLLCEVVCFSVECDDVYCHALLLIVLAQLLFGNSLLFCFVHGLF